MTEVGPLTCRFNKCSSVTGQATDYGIYKSDDVKDCDCLYSTQYGGPGGAVRSGQSSVELSDHDQPHACPSGSDDSFDAGAGCLPSSPLVMRWMAFYLATLGLRYADSVEKEAWRALLYAASDAGLR